MNTRDQLANLISQGLPNNSKGLISAAAARAVLLAIVEAAYVKPSDKVQLSDLSDTVQALIQGGLDPSKYQGTWTPSTNTPTIPAAGVGNAGHWYIAAAAGTATGNAAGTYAQGDRIQSNGTAWLKQPAPPVTLASKVVTFATLADELQAFFYPQNSPEFVYAVVDSAGRVAFGIRPSGELYGKMPPFNGSVGAAAIQPGAVSRSALAADLAAAIATDLPASAPYAFVIVDTVGRVALAVNHDGSVSGKFDLGAGSVTRTSLAAEVEDVLPESIPSSSGYHYAIVDSSGRVAFGITEAGYIYGRFVLGANSVATAALVDGSVTESKLAGSVKRAAIPSGGGRVEVEDDDGWRGRSFDVAARTSTVGSMFSRFAPARVRSIRGVNSTGTTLEFRRSAGLPVRGVKYRGTWDAATGSPDAAPLEGDWWNVTSGGTFGGVTYAAGDRLLALGTVVGQGAQYTKGLPGEMWFLGEFTPASHTPANIRDGDVWQASASGTFSGLTFATGDLLTRHAGVWGKFTSAAVESVANGSAFCFQCANAREIEVRRADKGTVRVGVIATGMHSILTERSTDAIVMWGDSMVATGGLNTAIAGLLAGRTFTGISYPGASAEQILAMVRKEIRGSDTYRGRFHAWFMSTNNATDIAQTREAALQAVLLSGAAQGRFVFLSVIGQSNCGWSGSRITHPQFEDSFAGSGIAYELEEWYKAAFPGAHILSRRELLARAPATPALLFPGMTEAQAATTYGAVPLSFFLDYTSKPWTPGALTFTGYHSTAGLPTGGADGDYKVRTANGTIGALQVRWAGTWTEHVWDITHMNTTGNAALAASFVEFLNTNQI